MLPANATPPVFNGNLVAGGKPWFDVTFYGAKGDGTTDDHAAIQAANSAASAACGTLYFPTTPNSYIYNSSTPLTISTCETVYAKGATVNGGASATSDFFQFASGNHANISVLPNVGNFDGCALHFMPGASQATVEFASFNANGCGVEFEGNNTFDNTVNGWGVASSTGAAVLVYADSGTDTMQGNIVNLNFADCNKYGIEFNTSSGVLINPTGVSINTFNLTSVDGCNVTGSIGVLGVTNFKVPTNLLNAGLFWGGFATARYQFNGGTSGNGIIARVFDTSSAAQYPQQFMGGLQSVGGDVSAAQNDSGGFGLTGGQSVAALAWNRAGQGEGDLYDAFANPGYTWAFYYWNGSAFTLSSTIGKDGTYTPGSTGAFFGPSSAVDMGPFTVTANSGGSAAPSSGSPSMYFSNNIAGTGQAETDFVSQRTGIGATSIGFNFYAFPSTTQTLLASLYRNGNFLAQGSVGWNNGPTITSGSGAPGGSCTAGAVYTRTDSSAAAGAEMYVCRNVAGTGTWEAVSGG